MKMTKNLTHIASSVEFEPAMTEEQLEAVFAQNGVAGFPAELDIAERTEEHVQMVSLEKFIAFAKASGLSAVTYDVTYFPMPMTPRWSISSSSWPATSRSAWR